MSAHPVRRAAVQGGVLLAMWMLLSGKFDAFHLTAGFAGVVLLLWLHNRLEPLSTGPDVRVHPIRWAIYVLWLLGQILVAAVHVARVILHPSRYLNPRLMRVRFTQPNVFASVALANSITITPGTLTVDLVDDVFEVHALTERTAQGLLAGSMPGRVARLFSDEPPPAPVQIATDTWNVPPLPPEK